MKTSDTRTIRIVATVVFVIVSIVFTVSVLFTIRNFSSRGIVERDKLSRIIDASAESVVSLQNALNTAFEMAHGIDKLKTYAMETTAARMRLTASELEVLAEGVPDIAKTASELSESARRTHFIAQELLDESEADDISSLDEMTLTYRELTDCLSVCAAMQGMLDLRIAATAGGTRFPDTKIYLILSICLAFYIVFSIVYMLIVFRISARALKRALKTLSDGTKELREGNLEYRFREITPDDIGQLKYDFNFMARRIEKQSSELRGANIGLREQAEQLIEAHQHKDRFLSNMSHELRTPLNSIIGFSELLEQRAEKLPPEKVKSYSQRILTAAEHLLGLITSLLDLAKSGAGTLKAVLAEFDCSFAIEETCAILKPLADKKNLILETDIQKNINIVADSRMIKQIFMNLFSNAVKYTPEGSIRVTLKRDPETNHVILSVTDTGIGIPQEEHKNIFKDFHRVDNGPTHMIDGVGIGLALSRRLAKLNNGEISFTSESSKGSTFVLTL